MDLGFCITWSHLVVVLLSFYSINVFRLKFKQWLFVLCNVYLSFLISDQITKSYKPPVSLNLHTLAFLFCLIIYKFQLYENVIK